MRPRKIFALLYSPEEDIFMGICLGACKLLNHIQTLKVHIKGIFKCISTLNRWQPTRPFNLPRVDQILLLLKHHFKDNLAGKLAVNVKSFFVISFIID